MVADDLSRSIAMHHWFRISIRQQAPELQQRVNAASPASPNFLHFVGLDRGRHPGLP
jgi:hypothetical protein